MKIICGVCGLTESQHHEFEPIMSDSKCKCDPDDWSDSFVKDICSSFEMDPVILEETGERRCAKCEHGEECHK